MAKQTINIGTTANDGTGDPLRTAFDKVNDNFTELYNDDAGDVNSIIAGAGISVDTATGNVTVTNTITNNNQLTNGAGYVDGSGTANRMPKFTDADTIGNSTITDTGTKIGVNNSNPSNSLDVYRNEATNILRLQNNTFSSWFGGDATGFYIETNLFKPITFKPSGVEAMTLNSSGNVVVNNNLSIGGTLIDSSNSSGTSGQVLSSTVTGTDWVSLSEISGVDGTGTTNYIAKWTDGDTIGNSIIYDNGTNVGIGVTNMSSFWNQADNLVIGGSSNIGLTIYSSSSGNTVIAFTNVADEANSGFNAGGSLLYDHINNAFITRVNGAERMRITSSGNVGIGTSSPIGKTEISSSNVRSTANGGADELILQNNGYCGMSIFSNNANAGQILFGDNDSNIEGYLQYWHSDNSMRFGIQNAERMRILSSGGITFNGDTAAANALDDYEEGTWTPAISFGGVATGITYGRQGGTYTKIGRQVTVSGDIILSSKGTTAGDARITGLPFTISSGTAALCPAAIRFANVTFANQFQGYGNPTTAYINLEETTESGVTTTLANGNFLNSSQIMVSLTYFVS